MIILCADCQYASVYVQYLLDRDAVTLVESGLSLDLMHSHVHLTWWVHIGLWMFKNELKWYSVDILGEMAK